ncbi:hypothetical protein [Metabacillus sp. Hm71]
MAKVTLTNMCMIYDKESNKVLVQDRIKSWKGISSQVDMWRMGKV